MIEHQTKIRRGQGPVLTLTVVGVNDVWRVAFRLCHGDVEHQEVGRATFAYLRKSLGGPTFVDTDRRLTGGRVVQLALHRKARETS